MKIIHTSDLHLGSALTSRLSPERAIRRAHELEESFARLCSEAVELSASAVIIAGDLFDTARVSTGGVDTVFTIMRRHPEISFFYLPGNHEGQVINASGLPHPDNLFVFGEEWTYFTHGDIRLAGRSTTEKNMMRTLERSSERTIAVLHGELRDKSEAGGIIGGSELSGCGVEYYALGHYHSYSVRQVGKGSVAVYCGTPEGRGFDEVGDCGFVLIDTDGPAVLHKFIPFAKRRQLIIPVDVTGAVSNSQIEERISAATGATGSESLVRIALTGEREPELTVNRAIIEARFRDKFFYFEIKDKTRIRLDREALRYDKSLKGEFLRLCLADESLEEDERSRIIECGFAALSGERWEAAE